MRYHSHIISSIALGTALTHYTSLNPSIGLFAGVIIGSLLPDIDEDESYIGKRSLGTAKVVKGIFGHRGMTHSLLATLIVFLPYFFIHSSIFLGLGMGYLFHILEDMLSKSGVPLFWFFTKETTKLRIKIPLYVTSHFSETIVAGLFVIGWIYMLIPFILTHKNLLLEMGVVCLIYLLGHPLSKMGVPVFHSLFKGEIRRKVMLGVCILLLFYLTKTYIPLV